MYADNSCQMTACSKWEDFYTPCALFVLECFEEEEGQAILAKPVHFNYCTGTGGSCDPLGCWTSMDVRTRRCSHAA